MATIGELAQLACTWEVRARKAGNVCPGREYPDLTVADFLASAAAIAPVLDAAPTQPLGVTILRAIEATRRVAATNTNLGIVLLLAPLASIPWKQPLFPEVMRDYLKRTTVEDARAVYQAIRLAMPAGLGTAPEQDISDEPTLPLREIMRLAAEHDTVAEQYADDFQLVLGLTRMLKHYIQTTGTVEQAVVRMQLEMLVMWPDSLIGRKRGQPGATEVRERVRDLKWELDQLDTAEGRQAFVDLDAWLRADNHARNPGTTADLIAAILFVALREGELAVDTPFAWTEHPFDAITPRGHFKPRSVRQQPPRR